MRRITIEWDGSHYEVHYLDDGADSGWRVVETGADTGVWPLWHLPREADLGALLAAVRDAIAPPLTAQQQEIAGLLAADTPRQAIADALRVGLSTVDRVARLVQGPAQRGRPRRG